MNPQAGFFLAALLACNCHSWCSLEKLKTIQSTTESHPVVRF